jgi:hypothetical protein
MSAFITCRCGRRLKAPAADEPVDCPACGRSVVRGEPDGRGNRVAGAVAAGFALVAVALVGLALDRPPSPQPVAAVAPEPAAPAPAPVVPPPAIMPDAVPLPPPEAEPQPIPDPVPVEPPPAPEPSPKPRVGTLEANVPPLGAYTVGEVVRQEVVFTRRSAFQIAGLDAAEGAQFVLTSSMKITAVNADGSFAVEQAIEKAKLVAADGPLKDTLAAALAKAEGTTFTLKVARTGEVTALDGLKDEVRVQNGKPDARGPSFRLWSILDADAWKELAGLTFFQPEKPLKPRAAWDRPASHDWGPLGSWRGKTLFVAMGKPAKSSLEQVNYRHDIYHKPAAAGADRELPFKIGKVQFQVVASAGAVLYDPATSRATAAEEVFRVRGAVEVSLLDAPAAVGLEEAQGFKLTIGDPKERELTGQPPKPRGRK